MVWPDPRETIKTPFLVTGLTDFGQDLFHANAQEWKSMIESGDHEKYSAFLREANLPESDNPL